MIMVDIYMPALDESFDFMLDENADLEVVILEVTEMIARRTKSELKPGDDGFVLYYTDKRMPLSADKTLYESGVRDADRLILV
jgi:hypothetical protein